MRKGALIALAAAVGVLAAVLVFYLCLFLTA